MSDSKAPAIRARLRYATVAEFKAGYSKFVSTGGMFIPVPESKLKTVGTNIRFQFMLNNGDTVLLGKGNVLQVRRPDAANPKTPIGMLIKFSKLSKDSKRIIDEIVAEKEHHKTPTQEVEVDDEEVRQNTPTPAAVVAISSEMTRNTAQNAIEQSSPNPISQEDISEDRTIVGTLDDLFSAAEDSPLNEITALPEETKNEKLSEISKDETAQNAIIEEELVPDERLAEPTEEPIFEEALVEELEEPVAIKPAEKIVVHKAEKIVVHKPDVFTTSRSDSNIRVLSYDDMSAIDSGKLEFEFSGDESEIDDMFDDLFGASGGTDFFDEVLGNNDAPEETPSLPQEIEIPKDDPNSDLEGFDLFNDPSEPELSMDDAFDSEPDDDLFRTAEQDQIQLHHEIVDPPAEDGAAISTLPEEDPLELINQVYSEVQDDDDDNPFRSDPPSVEFVPLDDIFEEEEEKIPVFGIEDSDATLAIKKESFLAPTLDDESSVLELDVEPDESEALFESFDHYDDEESQPEPPQVNISRTDELDSLLDILENDEPVGRSFDLSHESEKPPEFIAEDPADDSLEVLLALANKDIEAKKEETKSQEIDILDELLGEDLPPIPDDDMGFTMPAPEESGKKKGLLSKLFGKD